jgi:hypothetical protein
MVFVSVLLSGWSQHRYHSCDKHFTLTLESRTALSSRHCRSSASSEGLQRRHQEQGALWALSCEAWLRSRMSFVLGGLMLGEDIG